MSDKPPPPRNRPPGKQVIDREKYDSLLAAFREHGENFRAVAAQCAVHWNTAKRAWHDGWADQQKKPWALPIKDVLATEKIEARAALQREKDNLVQDGRIARQDQLREAIEDGFADLVDSRKKQGKVIRAARDNSIAALIVSQKLLKVSVTLADEVVKQLSDPGLDVFQRMRLLRQIARYAHDAVDMAQIVDEMERKALGEPDTVLQIQHGISMTVDDAKETLAEVAEVLGMMESGAPIEDVIDAEWADRDENNELIIKTTGGDNDVHPDAADEEGTDAAEAERSDAAVHPPEREVSSD